MIYIKKRKQRNFSDNNYNNLWRDTAIGTTVGALGGGLLGAAGGAFAGSLLNHPDDGAGAAAGFFMGAAGGGLAGGALGFNLGRDRDMNYRRLKLIQKDLRQKMLNGNISKSELRKLEVISRELDSDSREGMANAQKVGAVGLWI